MLVHTSGKRDEHAEDLDLIRKTLVTLSNPNTRRFERLRKLLFTVAEDFSQANAEEFGELLRRHGVWGVAPDVRAADIFGEGDDVADGGFAGEEPDDASEAS
jgi:hypothetical protein